MKHIDVVKTAEGWVGKANGRRVVSAATKREAVRAAAAKARASAEPTSVTIHRTDGTVEEQRSYSRRRRHRRRLLVAGAGDSGRDDTSERIEEMLAGESAPSR